MLPCSLAHASPQVALSGVPICTGAHSRGGGVRVCVCVCVCVSNSASSSPGSRGRCSQPRMPLAAETRSACDSLSRPSCVTYDPRPVGAPAALGWPVCP